MEIAFKKSKQIVLSWQFLCKSSLFALKTIFTLQFGKFAIKTLLEIARRYILPDASGMTDSFVASTKVIGKAETTFLFI